MNMARTPVLLVAMMPALIFMVEPVDAYPPAVGILAEHRSCTSCHIDNGPWPNEKHTIVDILDARTKKSLRLPDGAFLVEVPRGEKRTVLTVIGRGKEEAEPPKRNAWLYVHPRLIESSTLSKFAPGWEVDLPMACRIVGDEVDGYPGAHITVLPMTVRPTDAALDSEVELQVMLTRGDSVKGNVERGLVSNYLVRKVRLRVIEP